VLRGAESGTLDDMGMKPIVMRVSGALGLYTKETLPAIVDRRGGEDGTESSSSNVYLYIPVDECRACLIT